LVRVVLEDTLSKLLLENPSEKVLFGEYIRLGTMEKVLWVGTLARVLSFFAQNPHPDFPGGGFVNRAGIL
jgi:hypothetical protein